MNVKIEPQKVAQAVDMYVDSQLRDAAKYENRRLLDESGIWSLHALAADIYAMAWEEATRAADERNRYRLQREHDAAARPAPTTDQPGRVSGDERGDQHV